MKPQRIASIYASILIAAPLCVVAYIFDRIGVGAAWIAVKLAGVTLRVCDWGR